MDDDLNDKTGVVWDDCQFREKKANRNFALFGLKDSCSMYIAFSKKEVMDERRLDPKVTMAPLFYEKWYQTMRANETFSDLWCKGDEKMCAFANLQAFFSHTTHLQLKEAIAGDLPAAELQKVFNSVEKQSPVFLKVADSVVIVTAVNQEHQTWEGFDINDPHTTKTWRKDELHRLSILYTESGEPLPLGMPPQPCPSLA